MTEQGQTTAGSKAEGGLQQESIFLGTNQSQERQKKNNQSSQRGCIFAAVEKRSEEAHPRSMCARRGSFSGEPCCLQTFVRPQGQKDEQFQFLARTLGQSNPIQQQYTELGITEYSQADQTNHFGLSMLAMTLSHFLINPSSGSFSLLVPCRALHCVFPGDHTGN